MDFLVTQVNSARTGLESKDAAVRHYREEHMGKLPSHLAHERSHVGFESEPGRMTFYFDLPEWRRPVSRVKASDKTWLSER